MKKKLFIFLITAFLFLITFSGILKVYYINISQEVSKEIQSGIVNAAMASESPVYYDDGLDIIGVFFDKSHQTYVTYEKFPEDFINALIAVEDKNFFKHSGFDITAIFRAAIANLKAGRITQGGSTITQQAAKNLFNRQKRSYAAKFKELVQAIGIEREYSKKEILELYVNQFHVSGTGKGIGFATQYFFSKSPADLDLVEASFIAGSIKGPSRYNPFTKKTEREKTLAIKSAKERKDYVLSRMHDLGFITDVQYKQAVMEDVPFKKGQVTYGMNVILDIIRRQLQSEYFRKILSEQGIDNIATSGIRIYSSINREIQEGALKSLRKYLPILETRLNGYEKESLNKWYLDLARNGLNDMDPDLPDICEITGVDKDENGPNLTVNLGENQGLIGFDDGIRQLCEAWVASKYGPWTRLERKHIEGFMDSFKPGDLAAVQKGKGESDPLYLTRIPALQGGIIVLEKGMVKAMAGGYFNYFLNRAMDSRRQLGSIFKPIVYSAALQLKWNSLDELSNQWDIFSYFGKGYSPEPDHDPVANLVSMI
jgi:penicillin-binding protein 1A